MALSSSVAKPHSLFCYFICFHTTVLLLLQVRSDHQSFSFSHPVVKFLPGFQGPLPFHLETGYVGVDESDAVQLFYLFVKSERNPKEDPLLLWLVGGPRCSALTGFFYEIGPLKFELLEYNGSLPTLVLNPHSWTKVSSIIFVDLPVGTGFSYAKTTLASLSGDWEQIHHANQFLRKWLVDHPEFLSHPVYIGGDSYSGKTVPVLVQQISDGNEEGIKPLINLQGYILGNPVTEPALEFNSAIPFAHGMALISDELYESLKRNCEGEYQNTDPSNIECLKYMQAYNKCTTGIEVSNILMHTCAFAFTSQNTEGMIGKRSLNENLKKFRDPEQPLPEFGCHTYAYLLSNYWANDADVRKALHIWKGSAGEWIRCNYDLPYRFEIESTVQYHVYLSSKGYRSLIYSGDHDMVVPFLATQAWIRSLNYSILDDWRPWIVKGQVAGYARTYSNWMTFATVRGAGHIAIEFKPEECFAMFQRWISRETL